MRTMTALLSVLVLSVVSGCGDGQMKIETKSTPSSPSTPVVIEKNNTVVVPSTPTTTTKTETQVNSDTGNVRTKETTTTVK